MKGSVRFTKLNWIENKLFLKRMVETIIFVLWIISYEKSNMIMPFNVSYPF